MSDLYWVTGADNKEYGPVALETLTQWIREQRVVASTLVRRGEEGAREAALYPELAALLTDPPPAVAQRTPVDLPAEFAVWDFIGRAWGLVKPYWLELGLIFFIQSALGAVPYIGSCVQLIIGGAIFIGIWRTLLGLIDGRRPEIGMMFNGFDRFGEAFLCTLVSGVLILLGFVFLIVPGVILGLMWAFGLAILAEENIGFWEALKRSADLTRGYRWQLFLLGLANMCIVLVGLLAFCVGIFIAQAVAFTALALAYRFLQREQARRGGTAVTVL